MGFVLHHLLRLVVAVAPPKPDRVPEHVRGKLREEARDEILAPAVDAHVRPRQPQEKICLWRRSAPRAQLAEHVQTDPRFVKLPRPRARRTNVGDEPDGLPVVLFLVPHPLIVVIVVQQRTARQDRVHSEASIVANVDAGPERQ